MAGIGEQKLKEVLARARVVNEKVDSMRPMASSSINYDNSSYDYGNSEYDYNDRQPSYSNQNTQEMQYAQPASFGHSNVNTKLPKEVLKEMMENPIDVGRLDVEGLAGGGVSVLDSLNIDMQPLQTNRQQPQSFRQRPAQQQTQQPVYGGGGGIDYSLLKSIIDESISRHLSEIDRGTLNESKNNGGDLTLKAMKIGEKFQFIDSSGNLYEAKLRFIKTLPKK